jgi:hypothetical protein
MKTYLANEASDINYLAVNKDGKWFYFQVSPSGMFSSMITSKDGAYESFSTDEKLDFLKATCRLLSLLEEEDFNLDDLSVKEGDFDVPAWLLLDDYRQSAVDFVLHTTTNASFEFTNVEDKTVAVFYGATETETLEARKFLQRLDDFYNKPIDDNGES